MFCRLVLCTDLRVLSTDIESVLQKANGIGMYGEVKIVGATRSNLFGCYEVWSSSGRLVT